MTRQPHARLASSGLTLIELMVVISITVILALLAVPVGRQAYDQSRTAVCLGQLRSYGAAVMAALGERGGVPQASSVSEINFKSMLYPNYIKEPPHCPLATSAERAMQYGFHYVGNSGLLYSFPKLQGIPVPSYRIVLAAEGYSTGGLYSATHLNMTMWGIRDGESASPENEGSVRRAQYHGPPSRRGLNLFFLDGHAKLVSPERGDWWNEPTYGTSSNGGYFYNRTQFSRMAKGQSF